MTFALRRRIRMESGARSRVDCLPAKVSSRLADAPHGLLGCGARI